MSQDYSNLYGAPQTTAPPQPPQEPNPYNRDITPDEEPKPFVLNSSESTTPPPFPGGSQNPYAQAYRVPPQPTYVQRPPKPKQPFSPIPLLLIAGVAFLFLGGVLVLTSTWDTLPDLVRAIALLSVGVISFGVNVLAEKILKLPKTGLAFYILGCIFLPMAVVGIGAFQLFGEWFSFQGDGGALVAAAACACVAVSTMVGVGNYKHPFLAWMSLTASAGVWYCLTSLASDMLRDASSPELIINAVCCAMLLVLGVVSTFGAEWLLRSKPDTPYGKAALAYLYPILLSIAITYASVAGFGETPIVSVIAPILLTPLFCNNRFARNQFHFGIFGMVLCLMTAGASTTQLEALTGASGYAAFLFTVTAAAMVLLAFQAVEKLPSALRATAVGAGYVLSVPMLLTGGIPLLSRMIEPLFQGSLLEPAARASGADDYLAYNSLSRSQLVLGVLMALSVIFFFVTKKHPLTKDTPICAFYTAMLYLTAFLALEAQIRPLYAVLLILAALLLLAQGFLSRRIWGFVLAVASCGAMLLLNLPYSGIWLLWMGTGIAIGGVVYAHLTRRPLLEKCFAWVGIPLLLSAGIDTLTVRLCLTYDVSFILLFAVVTLLYLLEAVALVSHERTKGTKLYLEITAALGAFCAFLAYLTVEDTDKTGWGGLLAMLLTVFVIVFTRKKINFAAVPFLFMLFFTLRDMISEITPDFLDSTGLSLPGTMTTDTAAELLQSGCFVVMLVIFAVMGRILVPAFYDNKDGANRIDFPLLAGVLPIIAVAVTIDWYPAILFFLFLTIYSLFFIGRTQHRNIPALLASLFGCITLLLHNVQDPFGLLEELMKLDIQTLQVMMYLLPFHVFIFSLLFILPEKAKKGVHLARFIMYCITMLVLLISSLNFGNVADALILVTFSFLILVGSFVTKRLRWFALGFAVLVTMTIHLTWSFWRSLHWGIYLFLAGLLLIVIASVYEYAARYAREHPDEPKKKFALFATWKW